VAAPRPFTVDRDCAAHVAFDLTERGLASACGGRPRDAGNILDINDDAKEIVQELGAAINSAVESSPQVAEAIERLRVAGYEMELTLRLEIGLRERDAEAGEGDGDGATLELTDEDRRTLRSMKIRFDDAE